MSGLSSSTEEQQALTSYSIDQAELSQKGEWELVPLPDPPVQHVYPVTLRVQVGKLYHLPLYVAIQLESGTTVSRPVSWVGGEERTETSAGTKKYTGQIVTDDEQQQQPALVHVTVFSQASDPEEIESREPLACMLGIAAVRLKGNGLLACTQQARTLFLLDVDVDQLLYAFRLTCGLDTRRAPPMPGWDAMDCKLRGHTTGHVLSALAVGYAATGHVRLKSKLEHLAEGLHHPGYVGAFSEQQFDQLEQPNPSYPTIWAPWYTLHKLLAGLLDAYQHTGSKQALHVAHGLGDWTYNRLSKLTHAHRQAMLSVHIAGEFGGMNECLAHLYTHLADRRFLEAASWFNKDQLCIPLKQNIDALNGLHANTHVPQVLGLLQQYHETGIKRYKDAALRFWEMVVTGHCYAMGGSGQYERFYPPNVIAAERGPETAETCVSYNMLKLTARAYQWDLRPERADYYERTALNHLLATTDVARLTATSEERGVKASDKSMYYFPTQAGGTKKFDTWEDNTCCHGSGLEAPYYWAEGAFYVSTDALHVVQYTSCTVQAQGIDLEVQTDDAHPDQVALSITRLPKSELRFRVPAWAKGTYVTLDGIVVGMDPVPGDNDLVLGSAALDLVGRTDWHGAEIKVNFGIGMGLIRAPDNDQLGSYTWGPYVLAALCSEEPRVPHDGPDVDFAHESGLVWIHRKTGIKFVPLAWIHDEAYTLYVDVSCSTSQSTSPKDAWNEPWCLVQ